MKTKQTKTTRKQRLAIAVGCLLLSNWLQAPSVLAEEQPDNTVITEEVDVTDSRLKERQAIQKTEITSEQIKAQGAANAAQVLEKEAGIAVSDNNTGGKAAVSIRGSDATNTKVFIDGVPISSASSGVVDLSRIPADSIEKIEIVKGAAPVQYGSDASGGVIYITTKKGGQAGGSLSLSSGSWNSANFAGSVNGGSKKVNYFFAARHETTDGYTWNTEKEADSYNGKINFELNPKSSMSLFGAYTKKTEQLPDRYDPETGLIKVNPGDENGYADFWTGMANLQLDPATNWHSGLTFEHKFNANSELNMRLYKSRETSYMTGRQKGVEAAGRILDGGEETAGGADGLQLEHVFRLGSAHTVTWGYSKERRDFGQDTDWSITEQGGSKKDFSVKAQYAYDSHSYFIQDALKIGKLTATAGLRHNVVEDHITTAYSKNLLVNYKPADVRSDYSANNPVAGFSYALTDSTALHGSIGKSFRYPLAAELVGAAAVAGAVVKPEETLNRELGVSHTTPGGLNMDITVFNKKVDNLIQSSYYGSQLIPANLSEPMTMKGFEAAISQKLSDNMKAFAQVTYTSAKNPELGRQVNDVPKSKYSLGLHYTGRQGLNANLAINYVGSRYSQFSNTLGGTGGENEDDFAIKYDLVNLPSYVSVDLKLSKELKNREYYIKFNNLLDKEYYKGAYLIAPGRYVEFGTDIKF